MKIKQVEEQVGITRKNIRFYEEQGLLLPRRAENGYREYAQADVDRLMRIKLLRKLAVPLEEIRGVLAGTLPLETCLRQHLTFLETQRKNIEKMQEISRQMVEEGAVLDQPAVEGWLERMEKMEKEGAEFMDVVHVDIHRKKQIGALIAALVMIALMGILIAFLVWGNAADPIPLGALLFCIAIPLAVMIGIVIALVGRMKEISGGEEDEAAKY